MTRTKLFAMLAAILIAAGAFGVGLLACALAVLWLADGDTLGAEFLLWIFSPVLIPLLCGSVMLGLWRSHLIDRRSATRFHRVSES